MRLGDRAANSVQSRLQTIQTRTLPSSPDICPGGRRLQLKTRYWFLDSPVCKGTQCSSLSRPLDGKKGFSKSVTCQRLTLFQTNAIKTNVCGISRLVFAEMIVTVVLLGSVVKDVSLLGLCFCQNRRTTEFYLFSHYSSKTTATHYVSDSLILSKIDEDWSFLTGFYAYR